MRLIPALVVPIALTLACSGRASKPAESPEPATETPTEPAAAAPESPPMSESTFTEGPSLSADADTLVAWFEGEGKGRTVRLPVVVSTSPLGVTGGVVGTAPRDGALALKLDDGALAVSLHDQIRPLCTDGTCVVLLEGTWGPNVAMPGPGGPGGPSLAGPGGGSTRHPFAVRRVIGEVPEGHPSAVLVATE